ncbi:MAG: DUF502 domain-containing protein [Chloroflexi bacterium]|nr:DUF502 domain-containing protein [Chloroflexota bacterium]
MNKLRTFLKMTFIGGVIVLLPIAALVYLVKWMIGIISDVIDPFTEALTDTWHMSDYAALAIAVLTSVFVCFLVGLMAKTSLSVRLFGAAGSRIQSWLFSGLESRVLRVVPRYAMIRETVMRLLGTEPVPAFSSVALVEVSELGTMATAFVSDTHPDGSYTVFIPSGPNPTSGNVYHVKREHVHPVDVSVEVAWKSIVGCGAGSKKLMEAYRARPSGAER